MAAKKKVAKKGRPSAYKPEFDEQARKLCELGATDLELADFFGVSGRTIYRWAQRHESFCQSLKAGKEAADERVVNSLYRKAVGYEQEEVKIFMPAGAEEPVYAKYIAKHAPDTTAALFWLKNRRPDEWRDKQNHEITGKDGGPIQTATVDAAKLSTGALKELLNARSSEADE